MSVTSRALALLLAAFALGPVAVGVSEAGEDAVRPRTYVLTVPDGIPTSEADHDLVEAIVRDRLQRLGAADVSIDASVAGRLVVSVPASLDSGIVVRTLEQRGRFELIPIPAGLSEPLRVGGAVPDAVADVAPILMNGDIADAVPASLGAPAGFVIDLQLTDDAAGPFDDHARDHVGERIAFVIDGLVLSTPSISAGSYGGRARISGGFDEAEAVSLAAILAVGRALPLPVQVMVLGPG